MNDHEMNAIQDEDTKKGAAPDPFPDPLKRWVAFQYRDRNVRMSYSLPGHEPQLQFLPTGLTGKAGCNRFHAQMHLSEDRVEIGLPGSTKMHCPEPPLLMVQEEDFLGCLPRASRVESRSEGGQEELLMFDDRGDILLRFIRDPDRP